MKKFFEKFNDLELTIIIEAIVGVIAIGLSFIGFINSDTGWSIGVSTGVLISLISTLLVFKGSELAMKEEKMGLYFLFYLLRLILFVGAIVIFALCQYKWNLPKFYNSIWGTLIGYAPMAIILIVGQIGSSHHLDKKVEEKAKENNE